VPYLGICLGMQIAAIEIARNKVGLEGANSTEFDPETPHPVIALLESQHGVTKKGGTMRLGAYRCVLAPGSRAAEAYAKGEVSERHRHRFEFNNDYQAALESKGMRVTGVYPELSLVEIVELPDHPWFVGVQFHPELRSRPDQPHPLFQGFIRAANEERGKRAGASDTRSRAARN